MDDIIGVVRAVMPFVTFIAYAVCFGALSAAALTRVKKGGTGWVLGLLFGPVGLCFAILAREETLMEERAAAETPEA